MEISKTQTTIIDLPEELLVEIFKQLNIRCLDTLSCCCKLFRSVAADNAVWKMQFKLEFNYIPRNPFNMTNRELYIDELRQKRIVRGNFRVENC